MIDYNHFKRSVKVWIKDNPEATEADLCDYCEELIPPQQYQAHKWIVDQTMSWYRHILSQRDERQSYEDEEGVC